MFILEANASKPYNLGFKLHFRSKKKKKKKPSAGEVNLILCRNHFDP